jgi:hydrogenase-1 operon protein HyaE
MPSTLIERLVQNGYPRLDAAGLDAFLSGEGTLVLFLTGDPAKNLETDDMAVILPELMKAFPGRVVPAIVDRSIEQALRERFDVWPLPSLIFVERGEKKGAIAKMRGWDEFLAETGEILARPLAGATH